MNQMSNHVDFARGIAGWATLPTEADTVLATWQAATSFVTGNPAQQLHDDALSGTLTAKNIAQRFADAGTVIAGNNEARQLVTVIDSPLAQRFEAIISGAADSIVEQLRPQFDKAVAMIAQHAPAVPAEATAEELLSSFGSGAAEAWQLLAIAETTLDTIYHFRGQLSVRYGYPASEMRVCDWLAPVDHPERLTLADLCWRGWWPAAALSTGVNAKLPATRGGKWRHMVEHGFALRLNTASEAAAVAALRTPDPEPLVAA